MGDGSGFDLSKLAVGDEVGIERIRPDGSKCQAVAIVTAVDEDGIEADCDWWDLNGSNLCFPGTRYLCRPTDEGRIVSLREEIGVELNILGGKVNTMDLPALRRLHAVLVGLIAGAESPVGEKEQP